MMTNVMVKTLLNQEIIKTSKAEFIRIPNVPKCGLNTRHDDREVTVTHLTQAQILRCDK